MGGEHWKGVVLHALTFATRLLAVISGQSVGHLQTSSGPGFLNHSSGAPPTPRSTHADSSCKDLLPTPPVDTWREPSSSVPGTQLFADQRLSPRSAVLRLVPESLGERRSGAGMGSIPRLHHPLHAENTLARSTDEIRAVQT